MIHRKRNKADSEKSNDTEIRSFPLYSILVCGLIIIIAGLYLFIKNSYAQGISLPGRYGGNSGRRIILDGKSVIVIGLLFCIFPLYQIIKQSRKRQ